MNVKKPFLIGALTLGIATGAYISGLPTKAKNYYKQLQQKVMTLMETGIIEYPEFEELEWTEMEIKSPEQAIMWPFIRNCAKELRKAEDKKILVEDVMGMIRDYNKKQNPDFDYGRLEPGKKVYVPKVCLENYSAD